MPRTGHFKVDEIEKKNPAAYHWICDQMKSNASLADIRKGLDEKFGLAVSENAIGNWRKSRYSAQIEAQRVAVELHQILNDEIKNEDPEGAREKIIRGMIENFALRVIQNGLLKPEEIIKAAAAFRRLDNEKLKIQADFKRHEVELAKVRLAEKTAEKQIEYYKLKIAEIQKTANDGGQITAEKVNDIIEKAYGI